MATAASPRSSARSRLAAAAVALGVAALAATVLVAFLWPADDDPRRRAVSSYLERVDAAERSLAIELQRAARVYARLGDSEVGEARRRADVERSERAITALERRVRALRPPPEAVPFHGKLLALLTLQSSLARDATALVHYLPAQEQADRALAAALARLRRGIASSRDPAAQATAFARFESDSRRVAESLVAVSAPAPLEPLRQAARTRADRLATLGADVRTALARGDGKRAEALLEQLAGLVAGATTPAMRDAILAYNRRVELVARRHATVRLALAALNRELAGG